MSVKEIYKEIKEELLDPEDETLRVGLACFFFGAISCLLIGAYLISP